MQTAIQLYTLREVDEPFPHILRDVAAVGFDGVEFAHRVADVDPLAVRETLDETGIEAAGAHVGIDTVEEHFEEAVQAARALGYDDVVVPWLDPEHFESVEAVEGTAARLSALADDLADEGIRLHYHNHDQEFTETAEGPAFHLLADLTDGVLLEVDAGWALAAGADPVDLLRRYGGRITHVHVKDVSLDEGGDGEGSPPLGEGDLDIEAVVAAAREIDADWLVYEDDDPPDPETAHEHGVEVLAQYS